MLNNFELEEIEREYFRYILTFLKANLVSIIDGLNSRIKVLNDWYEKFIKTAGITRKHPSDLDTGAERIFHHFLASILHLPNSSPIGSDLMFEVPDAFIHIEIKTALIDNPADYKGKINVSANQTSYNIKGLFNANLPNYYNPQNSKEKPCLTYIIQIIHEHAKPNIKCLLLTCIPNGQLYSIYKKNILRGGKTKGSSFRYLYSGEPYFKLLSRRYKKKIYRVELVYVEKTLKTKDITAISDVPVHFRF
jgi:hypothetical protein